MKTKTLEQRVEELEKRIDWLEGKAKDPLIEDVIKVISEFDLVSASHIQRKFGVGYNRASKILEELEIKGYVGPSNGPKPRIVIKK